MLQAVGQAALIFLLGFVAVCAITIVYRIQVRAARRARPLAPAVGSDFEAHASQLLDRVRHDKGSLFVCAVSAEGALALPAEFVQACQRAMRRDDVTGTAGNSWCAAIAAPRAAAGPIAERLAGAVQVQGLKFGMAAWPGDGDKISILIEKAIHTAQKVVLTSSPVAAAFRELPGGWKDVVMPQELDQALGRYLSAHQDDPRGVSVLQLDIDNFKLYGEQYGPRAGTDIIQQLGSVMRRSVRYTDFVAHVHDDEFLVLMPALPEQARLAAQRLLAVVRKSVFPTSGQELKITVSFGIASYPANAGTLAELRELSALALRSAKARGRNTFASYDRGMTAEAAGSRRDTL
jgi:diguanylate cyclase (GGDEF)-like protein